MPTAIENIPKEIIFTNDMSESENTHTPNKEETEDRKQAAGLQHTLNKEVTEDKKQAAGIQAKIPKTPPSTAPPHYINEEEKKLFKWPHLLQYATIGGIYHNKDKDKYIASFNQLDTMTLTFGASSILDNTNHIVIGTGMDNALIKQKSVQHHQTQHQRCHYTLRRHYP